MPHDKGREGVGDREARSRATLLRLLRITLVTLIVAVIGFYIVDIGEDPGRLGGWEIQLVTGWPYVLAFAVVLAAGVIAIDIITPRKRISTLSGVFLGLVAGVLVAAAVGLVIDLLAKIYELQGNPVIDTIKVLVGIAVCYLCVSIVLQTQDDFRLVIPYVEFAKEIRGVRPLLVDSSCLIDGRIVEVGETGLLQAPLVVPRFVIAELQALADSSDRLKRARGRRGLDLVTRLQRSPLLDVTVDESPAPGKSVDQMLVDLARRMPATIITTDTALKRVGAIHSVSVINLHDVAGALRPSVLPGEPLRLRIIKRGEQAGQGVGYLENGTMVVVEDGGGNVGEEVSLTVTSTLQTSAGQLVFGRIGPARPDADSLPPDAAPAHDRAEGDDVRTSHADGAPPGTTGSRPDGAHHAPAREATDPATPLGPGGRTDRKRAGVRNPRRG